MRTMRVGMVAFIVFVICASNDIVGWKWISPTFGLAGQSWHYPRSASLAESRLSTSPANWVEPPPLDYVPEIASSLSGTQKDEWTRRTKSALDTARQLRQVQGATLRGTDLTSCNAYRAFLVNADLRGINATDSNFQYAQMQLCRLDDANLNDANLLGVSLQQATLIGTQIRGVEFSDVRPQFFTLNRKGSMFVFPVPASYDVSGTPATLAGATMVHVDLSGAKMSLVNFSGCLIGQDTNLTKATLVGARLDFAGINGSDLTEADFRDASMVGTKISACKGLNTVYFGGAHIVLGAKNAVWNTSFDNGFPEGYKAIKEFIPVRAAKKINPEWLNRVFYATPVPDDVSNNIYKLLPDDECKLSKSIDDFCR